MRIAVFTDTYLPEINGVTKTLGKLADYLGRNDHTFKIYSPTYQEARSSDDTTTRAKSFAFPLYPECRVAFPAKKRWRQELEELKPDLIHLVTPFPVGLAGLSLAKKMKVPLVASYHTNFDAYLKCYHISFLKHIYWPFFRWFHNQCTYNLVPSLDTKGDLENSGVNNVRIWARGIEADLFSPAKRDDEWRRSLGLENKKVILYVGRLGAEKSVMTLLKAMKSLNETHNGDDLHLVLVGDGPQRAKLERTAPDNATFVGFKRGDELHRIFASGDIFAFPSGTETLGNVVLEAMASGLPVVACGEGGIPDNVRHGETGLLHKYDNADDLAHQISTLLDNPDEATRLANAGRAYAESMSWDKIFDRLIADYEEACKNGKGKH
jgi:glycosyltransferase involved in cell wall biosynthesis